jgi:hypothetical protein
LEIPLEFTEEEKKKIKYIKNFQAIPRRVGRVLIGNWKKEENNEQAKVELSLREENENNKMVNILWPTWYGNC